MHFQIYDAVAQGPGVSMAKELCHTHAVKALKDIEGVEDGDAKAVLQKIISFLSNWKLHALKKKALLSVFTVFFTNALLWNIYNEFST